MTDIELRTIAVGAEITESPTYQLLSLCFDFILHGQRLADFDRQYRTIVRESGCGDDRRPADHPGPLSQLVTLGYVHALITFWDDQGDRENARSLPSVLRKLEALAQIDELVSDVLFCSRSGTRSQSVVHRLARFAHRVRKSPHFACLKKSAERCGNEVGTNLQGRDGQQVSELDRSVDRIFLCTQRAHQTFSRGLFKPEFTEPDATEALRRKILSAISASSDHPFANSRA